MLYSISSNQDQDDEDMEAERSDSYVSENDIEPDLTTLSGLYHLMAMSIVTVHSLSAKPRALPLASNIFEVVITEPGSIGLILVRACCIYVL